MNRHNDGRHSFKMLTEVEVVGGRELIADGSRARPQGAPAEGPVEIVMFRLVAPLAKVAVELALSCKESRANIDAERRDVGKRAN